MPYSVVLIMVSVTSCNWVPVHCYRSFCALTLPSLPEVMECCGTKLSNSFSSSPLSIISIIWIHLWCNVHSRQNRSRQWGDNSSIWWGTIPNRRWVYSEPFKPKISFISCSEQIFSGVEFYGISEVLTLFQGARIYMSFNLPNMSHFPGWIDREHTV